MAGAIRPGRAMERPTNWRAFWFPLGYPISRSRLETASLGARCTRWRAGPTLKAPRARCGGCAGNPYPILPPPACYVLPKTGVNPPTRYYPTPCVVRLENRAPLRAAFSQASTVMQTAPGLVRIAQNTSNPLGKGKIPDAPLQGTQTRHARSLRSAEPSGAAP
jgi:hypothetical protein